MNNTKRESNEGREGETKREQRAGRGSVSKREREPEGNESTTAR